MKTSTQGYRTNSPDNKEKALLKNSNSIWYVYRHRRLDTNEIFYVGIGKSKKLRRAYTKHNRNKYWTKIALTKKYRVEILCEGITKEYACELEQLLVLEYGRVDKKTGTLVNMTKGGETTDYIRTPEIIEKYKQARLESTNPNHVKFRKGEERSQETKDKISKGNKGIEFKKERLIKMSLAKKGKYLAGDNPNAKKVIDNETGIIYTSLKEAAEVTSFKYDTLKAMLQGRNPNKTKMEYYEK